MGQLHPHTSLSRAGQTPCICSPAGPLRSCAAGCMYLPATPDKAATRRARDAARDSARKRRRQHQWGHAPAQCCHDGRCFQCDTVRASADSRRPRSALVQWHRRADCGQHEPDQQLHQHVEVHAGQLRGCSCNPRTKSTRSHLFVMSTATSAHWPSCLQSTPLLSLGQAGFPAALCMTADGHAYRLPGRLSHPPWSTCSTCMPAVPGCSTAGTCTPVRPCSLCIATAFQNYHVQAA